MCVKPGASPEDTQIPSTLIRPPIKMLVTTSGSLLMGSENTEEAHGRGRVECQRLGLFLESDADTIEKVNF